jgi:FkbM family methyltransferase
MRTGKVISEVLRWIGHRIPDIRYVRAIPNLVLRPINRLFNSSPGVVNVLNFSMRLDPDECVDKGLWLAPQLYDCKEIDTLLKVFPRDGVFLDIGANIGFWSLRFASDFPQAVIYAIEANQNTFQLLSENIQINSFHNITPIHIGVSDAFGELLLYCNDTGNRDGDSFMNSAGRGRSVCVPVKPLASILAEIGVNRVDVIKMDIEGLEEIVLTRFFSDAPHNLWPRFICAEITHAPQIVAMLRNKGYRLVVATKENSIFSLMQDQFPN